MREIRPGVWEPRVYAGTNLVTGKPRYVSRTVHGGPRLVSKEMARLVTEVSAKRVVGLNVTFGSLLDAWLGHLEALGRSPTTIKGYRSKVEIEAGEKRWIESTPGLCTCTEFALGDELVGEGGDQWPAPTGGTAVLPECVDRPVVVEEGVECERFANTRRDLCEDCGVGKACERDFDGGHHSRCRLCRTGSVAVLASSSVNIGGGTRKNSERCLVT